MQGQGSERSFLHFSRTVRHAASFRSPWIHFGHQPPIFDGHSKPLSINRRQGVGCVATICLCPEDCSRFEPHVHPLHAVNECMAPASACNLLEASCGGLGSYWSASVFLVASVCARFDLEVLLMFTSPRKPCGSVVQCLATVSLYLCV